MAKFDPSSDQIRKVVKKAHNIIDRTVAGGLNPDAVCEALQEIYSWKGGVPLDLPKMSEDGVAIKSKLFKTAEGSYGLKTVRLGLTVEQVRDKFRQSGWTYTGSFISSNFQIKVLDKFDIPIGTERTLMVKRVIPAGEKWNLQKAVDNIGNTALAFDFEDLASLVIDHRDELIKNNIHTVVSPAGRFRDYYGRESMVYAQLGNRRIYLDWVGESWNSLTWFGSSEPC